MVKTAPKSIPNALAPRQAIKRPVEASKPVKKPDPESDEDDDQSTDFFGFNSAKVELPVMSAQQLPSFAPQPQIRHDAPMAGPSRLTVAANYGAKEVLDVPAAKKGKKDISDEVSIFWII
jgi:hypothetical protein